MLKKRPISETTVVETDGLRITKRHRVADDEDGGGGEDDDDIIGGLHIGGGDDQKSILLREEEEAIDAVDFEKIRREFVCPDEDCWGCEFRFNAQRRPGRNKNVDALWNEYCLNKGSMSIEALAKMIAASHDINVFQKDTAAGRPTMFWPESAVLRHLLNHMNDTATVLAASITRYDLMEKKIAQVAFHVKDGITVPHLKHFKAFETMSKLKLSYILAQDRCK